MMTDFGSLASRAAARIVADRRRARPFLLPLLLAGAAWLATPELTVATAQAQDFAAAGQRFAAAQEAFAKGDYTRAAREFQGAYDITQDPSLLFNIGESWQRAGDNTKAVASYRAYLKAQPDATDRAEVEKRLQGLEAAAPGSAAGADAAGGKPAPPPEGAKGAEASIVGGAASTGLVTAAGTGPERPATSYRTVAWGGVALTVAALTAGAIMGLGAQNRADELTSRTTVYAGGLPPTYTASEAAAYTSLKSEGMTYNVAAIACYSVGAAAAVVSTALFIADYRKGRAARSPAVAVGPASLTLGWRF